VLSPNECAPRNFLDHRQIGPAAGNFVALSVADGLAFRGPANVKVLLTL
jgi:hypothetical protein